MIMSHPRLSLDDIISINVSGRIVFEFLNVLLTSGGIIHMRTILVPVKYAQMLRMRMRTGPYTLHALHVAFVHKVV
jgi:hypothetical protein